ncbi:MAG TPA: tetraacyldisaccharide 4'-kinase [Candidatus Pelagibacter sp.]|jgi:tetraacyldisaccharide 4'-kinase|nr:tetraacyldisaccharide 4'-kinase [Candidatus Pelagibacter sp.]
MNFFKPNFWDKNQISFISIFLLPISLLIKVLAFLVRLITKSNHFSIPVICVGNIYLGGTGKTPLCIEIFSILKNLKMNPAFIRKKYDLFQDEANLQKKIGPIFQNKKRMNAINEAQQNKVDIAILDDGFQDFSIRKNLSIICFNEKQWIGNGLTIPAGPLRENISALKRADCVVINGKKNIYIENKIFNENKKIKIFYSKYKPQNIDEFKSSKVTAFAGIGNPENFFNLLKDNQIKVIEEIKYPDHYQYPDKELEKLINISKSNNTILITTEKDYFRINSRYKKSINLLKIKIEIENKNQFIEEIKKII